MGALRPGGGGGGAPLSDATPQPTGTAAAGVSTSAARADHVHAASVAAADITDGGASGVDVVQAETPAEVRAAIGAQSWACAGSTADYAAASAYTSPPTASTGEMTASGRLGDGTITPRFSAIGLSAISALARNATGLRLTHATSNSGSAGQEAYPLAAAGAAMIIPLFGGLEDFQIDVTYATNIESVGRASGGSSYVMAKLALLRRTARYTDQVLPDYLMRHYLYSYAGDSPAYIRERCSVYGGPAAAGEYNTAVDVSSAGEGTSGGVTARAVRIVVSGLALEVLTGPAGGSLTQRRYYSSARRMISREGLALSLALMQYQAGGALAGYYAELRSLSVTPL